MNIGSNKASNEAHRGSFNEGSSRQRSNETSAEKIANKEQTGERQSSVSPVQTSQGEQHYDEASSRPSIPASKGFGGAGNGI